MDNADLHLWVVWERKYSRRGFAVRMGVSWQVISSHKTKVAADVAATRGYGRIVRRASHGQPTP